MNVTMIMGVAGVLLITLGYIIGRANFICKLISIIFLIAGEALTVLGLMGYIQSEDSLPIALAIGGIAALGQRPGLGALGMVWNKPKTIKFLYTTTGVLMLLATLAMMVMSK